MDIQKLEKFEDWFATRYPNVQKTIDLHNDHESIVFRNNQMEAWQAAKAQADQKIKLLLCDEHLKKCESPAGVFNSQYPDEEPCLICLAKEAKAQAVPDGFVVVPTEPTERMLDSAYSSISDNLHYADLENIYRAMIEAQEQSHD